jgi:hypothetical protein
VTNPLESTRDMEKEESSCLMSLCVGCGWVCVGEGG